jgi:hypothetical protein
MREKMKKSKNGPVLYRRKSISGYVTANLSWNTEGVYGDRFA